MTQVFADHTQQAVQRMRARGDGGRRVIDMQDVFYRFTMDSIGCIAFGKSLGCLQVNSNSQRLTEQNKMPHSRAKAAVDSAGLFFSPSCE